MTDALVIALVPHLLPLVLSALGAALAPLVAMASPKVHELIRTKVTNARLQAILGRAADAAFVYVAAVSQTTVDAAKAAAKDGKVPEQIAADAKAAAVQGVKRELGPLWLELVKALGEDAATSAVEARVEAAVATHKKVVITTASGQRIVAPAPQGQP